MFIVGATEIEEHRVVDRHVECHLAEISKTIVPQRHVLTICHLRDHVDLVEGELRNPVRHPEQG